MSYGSQNLATLSQTFHSHCKNYSSLIVNVSCWVLIVYFSDFSFDITNRISFARIRQKFANKLFQRPPAIFRNTAGMFYSYVHVVCTVINCTNHFIVQKSGMLYIYCEIRPKQDKLKNVRKTVKYLRLNEWVGVVHPHKKLTIYLIPTSTVSHNLGGSLIITLIT